VYGEPSDLGRHVQLHVRTACTIMMSSKTLFSRLFIGGFGIQRRVCRIRSSLLCSLLTLLVLFFKTRTCNTTGSPCIGSHYEVQSCNSSIPCPVDGVWGAWGNYSECTVSCGSGTQTRTRVCVGQSNGGQPCFGSATQTIACATNISCPGLCFRPSPGKRQYCLSLEI
jgi:hypothetical protein